MSESAAERDKRQSGKAQNKKNMAGIELGGAKRET